MPITCLIFDADNTLYQTKKAAKLGYIAMFQFLHQKTGIAPEKLQETYESIVNKVKKDLNPAKRKREYAVQRLLQKFFKDSPKLLAESMEVFWEVVGKNIQPVKGVKKLIDELAGKYTLVVASDEFQKPLMWKLKATLGKFELFRMIVTPEVTKTMKPSRIYYDKIIEELAIKPEQGMMIGDSWERDLEIARMVGLKTVLVAVEREGNPHFWIKELAELPLVLEMLKKKGNLNQKLNIKS